MRAHAKINLTLRVGERQPDGYHDLRTVFQSLALHDTLDVVEGPGPLAIACDDPAVPVDERNLVWKAAALVWEAAGRTGTPQGARVVLRKRIPAQGGLGGGSADAAAAIVAFGRLWGAGLSASTRRALARRLGADVAFFLCGGTAAGAGRGDELTPLADLPRHHVALVFPPFGVSTALAYGWLDEDRARAGAEARPHAPLGDAEGRAEALPHVLDALPHGPRGDGEGRAGAQPHVRLPDGTAIAVGNDLEAPVAARHPEIAGIRDGLLAAGACAAAMSGSGSTVFGLFTEEGAARAAAGALGRAGWRTALTATASREEALRFLV